MPGSLHRSRWVVWLALLLVSAAAIYYSREWWLRAPGQFLIKSGPPAPAQAVIVLAGDPSGNRLLKAAELVRQGFAPIAIISGPQSLFGHNEAELAIDYAVRHGYSRSCFSPLVHEADSTREEAAIIWRHLQEKDIRSFLLVTSDYHTRRSSQIFHSVAKGGTIYVVSAPTPNFKPDSWWKARPGRKVVFLEWAKTIAEWLGV